MSSKVLKMRNDARAIFDAAVASVIPDTAVKNHMRLDRDKLIFGVAGKELTYSLKDLGNIYVFGAGKASVPMADACEEILGPQISYGHIITKKGAKVPRKFKYIDVSFGGHPVPDEDGVRATESIVSKLKQTQDRDLVILLLSGGGSAILTAPVPGITLSDLQQTTSALLECGASIHEINTIRKHLSSVKGGNFAKHAAPSHVVSLILSDVVGDTLDVIASGPTVADSSSFRDCLNIVQKYQNSTSLALPAPVLSHLNAGVANLSLETPKARDPLFLRTHNYLVANNYSALCAAKQRAASLGYTPVILSSSIEGEAREVGKVSPIAFFCCPQTLVSLAKEVKSSGNPVARPACLILGGETTVTIRGKGKGGRSQEMALSSLQRLAGLPDVTILCGGTDGGDGPTDAAGAIVDESLLKEVSSKGLNLEDYLSRNDSYSLFHQFPASHLKPGPTGTNVMDIDVVLVQ